MGKSACPAGTDAILSAGMYGTIGQILEIDLTSRRTRTVRLEAALHQRFLGGRGLAGHFVKTRFGLPATDPAMVLAGFAGPLTGSGAPSTDGLTILSKSPLTGAVGDVLIRGAAGRALKCSGYDGVVIFGKASALIGIEIDRDSIFVRDATVYGDKSLDDIAAALGDGWIVVSIGPAGERMLPIAGLSVNHGEVEGLSGLGAVLGAKNVKYVAIRNRDETSVAFQDAVERYRTDITRLATASPALLGAFGLGSFGTPTLLDLLQVRRMLPTENFQRTFFEAAPFVNAHALHAAYPPVKDGCPSCPVGCQWRDGDGRRLPGLDALVYFTAVIGNPDLSLAVSAFQLSERLGLAPVSTASSIACYQDITQTRLSPDALMTVIEEMAFDNGRLGPALNRGPSAYSLKRQRPGLAMTVKGMPLSAFDPRGAVGTALSMAVSTTGGCARRADMFGLEVLRKPVPVDRFSFDGKARMVKIAEDRHAVADALVACRNIFLAASMEEYGALLGAVTGIPYTGERLMRIGERIIYQERLMNFSAGIHAGDDDLPLRFFEEPGTSGPGFDIPPIDRESFLEARKRYYRIRGLEEDGTPRKSVADSLELEWNG